MRANFLFVALGVGLGACAIWTRNYARREGGVGLKNGLEMGRVGGRNLCCKVL